MAKSHVVDARLQTHILLRSTDALGRTTTDFGPIQSTRRSLVWESGRALTSHADAARHRPTPPCCSKQAKINIQSGAEHACGLDRETPALSMINGAVPTGSRGYMPGPGVMCYTLAYIRSACSVPSWIPGNSLLFPVRRTVNGGRRWRSVAVPHCPGHGRARERSL